MNWKDAKEKILIPITTKSRIGLFTDMDGTISSIVEHAASAQVSDVSRRLLNELAQIISLVVIISGRSLADLKEKVSLPMLTYVGNHGLERWEDGIIKVEPETLVYRPHLDKVKTLITPQLEEAMWIEDKGVTLTVHYRQSPDPEAVEERFTPIINKIVAQEGLLLSHGKMAFEIRPKLKIDKGTTVQRLITQYKLDAAVYLGDDTNDIPALLTVQKMRNEGICIAAGIGVESEEMPDKLRESADMMASSVKDIEAFLEWFTNTIRKNSNNL